MAEKVQADIEALGRKAIFFNVNAADDGAAAGGARAIEAELGEPPAGAGPRAAALAGLRRL